MTELEIVKSDLQMLTNTSDDYLQILIDAAGAAMEREGITDDETPDYVMAKCHYAAYLFRKRAGNTSGSGVFAPDGGETAMPRFLRYELNNLLMSQKLKEGSE